MVKKLLGTVLLVVVLAQLMSATLSFATPAGSAPIRVVVDGQLLTMDVSPILRAGRTLVPVRAIFEALGVTVGWEEATQTVTGQRNGKTIILRVGNPRARVGDSEVALSSPPAIVNGRTMAPVRFIAESLGAVVNWNEATRTVEVTGTGATTVRAGIIIASVDLTGEMVVIRNNSTKAVDVSNWTLVSENGNQRFVFPRETIIQAGASLTIVSGPRATAGAGRLIWTTALIWDNDGDPAVLLDANNVVMARRDTAASQRRELSFRTVTSSFQSGYEENKTYVIRQEQEWNSLRSKLRVSLPAVNFTQYMVVAAFQGRRRTGGYSIEITNIIEGQDNITVYITETSPRPEDIVIQILTDPFHIVKLERNGKNIVFNITRVHRK